MMNHFARMQKRITGFVEKNSGMSAERFTELMMNTGELITDVGSVLDGQKAVQEGLIDSLGGLSDVMDVLNKMIEERTAPVVEEKKEYITNGDIIAEAIRTRDSVLKFEMERRFKVWCEESKESPFSAGAKKHWKTLRFEK